ncbi:MAG: hypothetical protein D6778_08510 [Nitrospirae bacterium]|nr:MAG: hypothetical protein D6778_08510 [Nitrospirota bacterium]
MKRVLIFTIGVFFLFALSCTPRVVRHVSKEDAISACLRAEPRFPLVARVGVNFKENGQDRGSVAGLLFVRDRRTFKIALLGPFGSQKGKVYFLSGNLVAYKDGEKVLDTVLPIDGLPEVSSYLERSDIVTEDKKVVLEGEVEGKRLFCRVDTEDLQFEGITVHDRDSTLSLEGFRDGFYKRISINKGERRIEIKVKEVRHKDSLKDEIFRLP